MAQRRYQTPVNPLGSFFAAHKQGTLDEQARQSAADKAELEANKFELEQDKFGQKKKVDANVQLDREHGQNNVDRDDLLKYEGDFVDALKMVNPETWPMVKEMHNRGKAMFGDQWRYTDEGIDGVGNVPPDVGPPAPNAYTTTTAGMAALKESQGDVYEQGNRLDHMQYVREVEGPLVQEVMGNLKVMSNAGNMRPEMMLDYIARATAHAASQGANLQDVTKLNDMFHDHYLQAMKLDDRERVRIEKERKHLRTTLLDWYQYGPDKDRRGKASSSGSGMLDLSFPSITVTTGDDDAIPTEKRSEYLRMYQEALGIIMDGSFDPETGQPLQMSAKDAMAIMIRTHPDTFEGYYTPEEREDQKAHAERNRIRAEARDRGDYVVEGPAPGNTEGGTQSDLFQKPGYTTSGVQVAKDPDGGYWVDGGIDPDTGLPSAVRATPEQIQEAWPEGSQQTTPIPTGSTSTGGH